MKIASFFMNNFVVGMKTKPREGNRVMTLPNRQFDCPNCKTKLTATPKDFGGVASCPECQWSFQVPKPSDDEPVVKFYCTFCQTKLSATKEQVGQEMPCPNAKCRKPVLVPEPEWKPIPTTILKPGGKVTELKASS